MIVKRKKWEVGTPIKQICGNCLNVFHSKRIKKYCTDKCRLEANRLLAHMRYDKLRRAYLESLRKQNGKEVYNK